MFFSVSIFPFALSIQQYPLAAALPDAKRRFFPLGGLV
jgi:hypothetical protein